MDHSLNRSLYKYARTDSIPGNEKPGVHMPKNAKIVEVNTGYKPRPLQYLLHQSLKRFNVLVCHRRFGKTVFSINHLIDRANKNQKHNPFYAYIAPTYKQAKIISWEYLQQYTEHFPDREIHKGELTITINRKGLKDKNGQWIKRPDKIRITLLGADNPDSIRGIYLDGCIMDEYAQCDPRIWGEIVRPALSDRRGWAIFIGTPQGQNHFYHRYKKAIAQPDNWFTSIYKASETGIIPTSELNELWADMDKDEYEQEMECSFTAAIKGSYYGHIINRMKEDKRIGHFPYDPHYPVETFWDLGVRDSTAIVFRQKKGSLYYYIDYFEDTGQGLDYFVRELMKKPYAYARHVLPWDAKAKDLGTGLTRQETLKDLGLKRIEVQTRQAIMDRIQATRDRLKVSFIDEKNCARLLECLMNYQKQWDAKLMRFADKPLHDWSSNGADSFGYSALDKREPPRQYSGFGRFAKEKRQGFQSVMDYNELG